jgi:hypothetical protein
MAYQSAQGLASLGRNGDTMLVHMNPTEVAGLQSLAMAHGGSLTVNPDTGMPEAFNLGGVFKAALPMIAGAALGPAGFGLTGLQAGLLVGGATALLSGDIGQGLMAGFGAGAGSSLGQSLSNFAKQGAASNVPTGEFMGDVIQNQVASTNAALPANTFGGASAGGFGAATKGFGAPVSGQSSFLGSGIGNTPISGVNLNPTSSFMKPVINAPAVPTQSLVPELTSGVNKINLANTSNLIRPEVGAGSILSGAGRAIQNPGQFIDYMGGGFETAKQVGLPLAGVVAGGVEESDLYPKQQAYAEAPSNAVDPLTGRLRLKYDTGLRLNPTYAKEGGEIKYYAVGGNVGNPSVGGGLSDLYNRPEGQALENISQDGYGIGRLNTLAQQESLQNAKTLGYAMGGLTALKSGGRPGGYLDGAGDGMSDSIPATIEGKQPARLADGEFVVPADVVSHLGNGSSKAGSKRLYAMMDKVRHARTGNKKQGKQINPDKYLPKLA